MIDFVITSNDLVRHITQMHIDDDRRHVLTKSVKTKTGIDYSESDHNIINTKLKVPWSPKERPFIEVIKYHDKEALEKF